MLLALAGFVLGVVVGIFVVGIPVIGLSPMVIIIIVSSATFFAGIVLGRAFAPKSSAMRLTGRIFEFPQGPVMVEVSLRRMKSILPTEVTQE